MATIMSANWVIPVVTLLIGYGTKSLSDWIQFKRDALRAREAREAERSDKLFERRNEMQRQSLLELQEAIMQLARATGAAYHQDEIAFGESGKWQKQLLAGNTDEAFQLAQTQAAMFSVRIRDDRVRKLTEQFRMGCTSVILSNDRAGSLSGMQQIMVTLEELNQRVGEIVRTLDNDV